MCPRLVEIQLRADNGDVKSDLVICIVLVALGGSAVVLPVDGHNEAEPTSTGPPCLLLANGEELCGQDAAIWCNLRPSVEAEPGLPEVAPRDDCLPRVRWTSY